MKKIINIAIDAAIIIIFLALIYASYISTLQY